MGDFVQLCDELGLDNGVRSTNIQDVLRGIHEVLADRLRQVRNVRDLGRRSISTRSSKIAFVYKQLGRDETKAHEFISEHTGPSIPLLQSQDALMRHLDELVAVRANGHLLLCPVLSFVCLRSALMLSVLRVCLYTNRRERRWFLS